MNRMKTAFAIALPAALLAISAPAIAQQSDAGWYIGGSYGISNIDVDTAGTGFGVDGDDTGFKIFGGFQFNKHWGAEVGYLDAGKASVTGPGGSADLSVTALTLAGTGTLPLNESFSLLGKVGLWMWDTGCSGAVCVSSYDDSSTDLFYGVGARFNFNRNWSMQVEWEQFETSADAVTLTSLGVRYKF
ncbi:MAG TPA: outer membrane beta-barrel protein [Burkholderiales bacterium]|jgi:OOP family OmpA-OmpF porin|nr:outer membrane beta-barrel protein [Burkholderiales bacterium]